MTFLAFDSFILVLCIFSIILHIFGTYVLLIGYYKKKERRTTQRLFLINFSLIEVTRPVCDIILLSIAAFSDRNPSKSLILIQHLFSILSETMFTFLYYSSMFQITLERLLAVVLSFRYRRFNTLVKTKTTIAFTWLIAFIIGLAFCLLHIVFEFYYIPYNYYVYISLDVIFFFIALSTYGILFARHKRSLVIRKSQRREDASSNPSSLQIYKESKFYIPTLLMASFLFLMIIPDFVYIMLLRYQDGFSVGSSVTKLTITKDILWHCMVVLNVTSNMLNACIYIFADKTNRKIMYQLIQKTKLSIFRKCCLDNLAKKKSLDNHQSVSFKESIV